MFGNLRWVEFDSFLLLFVIVGFFLIKVVGNLILNCLMFLRCLICFFVKCKFKVWILFFRCLILWFFMIGNIFDVLDIMYVSVMVVCDMLFLCLVVIFVSVLFMVFFFGVCFRIGFMKVWMFLLWFLCFLMVFLGKKWFVLRIF